MCGVKFPQKNDRSCGYLLYFPVNIDGIQYATAQIVAKRDGKIYLEQIAGIPTEIAVDGKVLRNVRAKGLVSPIYRNIYLLTSAEAENLFCRKKKSIEYNLPYQFRFIKTGCRSTS